jgi:two-component system, chemotaxis family, chemotaxis protein CheY
MKILLVDDSSSMRRIQKKLLGQLGETDVVEASDGIVALQELENIGQVDLILTDWNMPNMDGITFVREVRAKEQWKSIPIIMVTTEGEKSRIVEAAQAGVNNYLTKPFTPDLLAKKIAAVTG